jgi:hypothetical protein
VTYPGDWYIPPCDPVERNRLLTVNAANGWRARPGLMDWDQGWTFDSEHATAPLIKPKAHPVPSRPVWVQPHHVLLVVFLLAAVLGVITR